MTDERSFLEADLAAIDGLLDELGPSDLLMRHGLEARRAQIQSRLEQEHRLPAAARASFYFSGTPVIGSTAIEAKFLSDMLGRIQHFVMRVAGREQAGKKKNSSSPGSRLFVSQFQPGSFGFELVEPMAVEQFELAPHKTHLAVAVGEAADLMAASAGEGDSFSDYLPTLDRKTLNLLRRIFQRLDNAGAQMRIKTGGKDIKIDHDGLVRALERTTSTMRESLMTVSGTLTGFLLDGMRFELQLNEPLGGITTIRGRVSPEVSPNQARDSFLRPCHAKVRIVALVSGTRQINESFELLHVEPQDLADH